MSNYKMHYLKEKTKEESTLNPLEPKFFYFDLPLYTPIVIEEKNIKDLEALLGYYGKVDGYNPIIKENTTFQCYRMGGSVDFDSNFKNLINYGGVRELSINCLRTSEYFHIYLHFNKDKKKIMKIGQYPSIADIHISQIKQYDKVLSENKLKEFTRAIGLAANGVGIGSFVYLRRIFEDLIEEAHSMAKSEANWNEDLYTQKRIVERIELIKHYLPDFLVENKNLYGILSVGIHSLKEEDCLLYFDSVKVGIELILDEKLEKFNKELKVEDAKKKLSLVTSKLKCEK